MNLLFPAFVVSLSSFSGKWPRTHCPVALGRLSIPRLYHICRMSLLRAMTVCWSFSCFLQVCLCGWAASCVRTISVSAGSNRHQEDGCPLSSQERLGVQKPRLTRKRSQKGPESSVQCSSFWAQDSESLTSWSMCSVMSDSLQ